MIDTHLHILPALDDGSRNLEESLTILKNLEELGFTDVLCTTHFIPDSDYCPNNKTKNTALKKVQTAAKKQRIKIKLHPGNEVYIDPKVPALIKSKDIQLINKSFILFELPFYSEINNLEDILHELKIKNIIPILAHPERYFYFQKNPEKAAILHASGILFQANYGSIINQYGRSAKKLLKYLLKHDLIDFFGTDIHHTDSLVAQNFPKILKKLSHCIGKDKLSHIQSNADNLIK